MREEGASIEKPEKCNKRVGIFGGSFDPVHEGHISLASLAREAARLDEIWFLPCQVSPHKTGEPPSSGEERLEWLRVALKAIPWARIDETELGTEGPSYSYLSLEELNRKFPENEWFWIMGGDQWTNLPKWSNPEKIAKLASFVVLARNGMLVEERIGYRMQKVEGEHPASSSSIREALAIGQSEIPFLNPEVARLIHAKKGRL